MKLKDRIAIVTGAAKGIGRACAQRLIAEGALVTLADIDDAAGVATAASLGDRAQYLHCDVGDSTQVDSMVTDMIARHGAIDILINNAGISRLREHTRNIGSGFRPGDPGQPQGRLPGRPGGRPSDGEAGRNWPQGRRHRQHVLGQCRRRDRVASALFGIEGRHQSAHQGDGTRPRGLRHPRQCHWAGLDHDRHADHG